MRKFTTLATASAIVLTSLTAVPAEARGRHHGGWGYRDRDHISTGEVIGGLLILGTIAAIASAASKEINRPPSTSPVLILSRSRWPQPP